VAAAHGRGRGADRSDLGPVASAAMPLPVVAPAIDLRRSFGHLRHGPYDPTTRVGETEAWRAVRTPHGPGTLALRRETAGITAEAFGPGRDWLLTRAGAFAGALDDPSVLVAHHRAVADAAHRFATVRLPRSHALVHELVVAVCGQRVTSVEAVRSWRGLCRVASERAPGPMELLLPPDPGVLARQPYWWFHRFGIDRRRAETIRAIGGAAVRIDALAEADPVTVATALARYPGIGPWSIGTALGAALGDPDAVPIGDFHLPHVVSYALAGEPRADDARMLDLLEPYRGQRGRVVRLLALAGARAPAYGPRRRIVSIRDR
jgi:3-methyladenine DNA glycosylase/8-oxoguanine DNA glycosylase